MVLVLIPVGVLLYFLVAYATAGLSHQWAEAVTRWIVDVSPFGSTFGKPIAKWIVQLANWISNRMAEVFTASLRRGVNWFGGIADYVKHLTETALAPALDLVVFARWLLNTELPRLVHALPTSVSQLVHDMAKALHSITAEIPRLERYAKGVAKAAAFGIIAPFVAALPALGWLKHHLHSIVRAAAHAGGAVLPWADLPDIKKWLHANRARIARVEALLGIAGATALVARALGVSAKCIKNNGNIKKVAKAICKADVKWLENLLLGALAIFGVISIRTFAVQVYGLMGDAVKEVAHFWQADLNHAPINPDLGDIGGKPVALRGAHYVSPSPGLGDVA